MKKIFNFVCLSLSIFAFFLSAFPSHAFALQKNPISLPVVTVINPIRGHQLGLEHTDLLRSLEEQYHITKDTGIHATWLWQYSALEEQNLTNFARNNMSEQEFGLFLEVDRNFAEKSDVVYRGKGPWYFSDGLLPVSYDQGERKKLIDTAFAKFKQTFGYYPKTVGAWWISADMLTYMQKKYGIVASLRAADQFDLDAYSIWGTPWSIPYVSSKDNAGMPANALEDSSKVVILQWAARDPTRAYGDSGAYSTYSLQDYALKKYNLSYFDYLTSIYLRKPLDEIVIGLEGGLPPSSYQAQYKKQLEHIRLFEKQGKIKIALAKDYAQTLLAQQRLISPTHYFLTKDFQTDDASFWYMSENFRAGIQKKGNAIFLVDLRDYTNRVPEDFTLLPNSQGFLRISEPAIIDSVRFPEEKRLISESKYPLKLKEIDGVVTLLSGDKKIASFTPTTFQFYSNTFAPGQNPKLYDFHKYTFSINIFVLLVSIFFAYCLFIFWRNNNVEKSLVSLFLILLAILLAYPFLSVGTIDTLTYFFDKKEFVLFPLLTIPYLAPPLRIIIVCQILPFLFLFLFHYIFTIRHSLLPYRLLFFCYLMSVILFFIHFPYFPLDRSTYSIALGVLSLSAVLAISVSCILFYKTKSKKLFFMSLLGIGIFLMIIGATLLISRSTYIVTPFEMDALNVIANRHRDVVYLYPEDKPTYKAVKPVLYDNYYFAERLTDTHWHLVTRAKNHTLQLPQYTDNLLLVPRYLGSDLSKDEMRKYNLIKVFDNAQIALFEENKDK